MTNSRGYKTASHMRKIFQGQEHDIELGAQHIQYTIRINSITVDHRYCSLAWA